MLISHADIAELIREEGLRFHLIKAATEAGNPALGIPPKKSESKKLFYGTLKPPKLSGIDTPQLSSKEGELMVYFPALNLTRQDLASAQFEHGGQRYFCQYMSEVDHRGVALMHQVKLVAGRG
jgi:hypothetical protein